MKRYLTLAKNIALSNVRRLDFPYKLTFVTTYACNYRCKTCNIWERRPKGELTLEEIRQFFRKSPHFSWIDFTGGEPWLRRDFPDIVEAALDSCPALLLVHFPTNGYLTDQIVAGVKRIMARRPPKLMITVSTDGNEAVNDEVRGMKGGWRRQIETYKRLHEIPGVEVVLGMTLSALNAKAYQEAFDAAKAECPWLTSRDYHLNIVHESQHYYGNEGAKHLRDEGEKEILAQIAAYRRERGVPKGIVDWLEYRYLRSVPGYVQGGTTPMRCHALHSSCFVDSWGNVYPCAMYDAKVANLRDHEYDLGEIWKLHKTRELQKEIWDYQCPQCWTPCEAYQSVLGNLLGLRNTAPNRRAERVLVAGQPRQDG
jgi:MoaA/NifB/PqqE/SkfB family radical SAM enzyme